MNGSNIFVAATAIALKALAAGCLIAACLRAAAQVDLAALALIGGAGLAWRIARWLDEE